MKKCIFLSFILVLLGLASLQNTRAQVSLQIGPHIGLDTGDAGDLGGDFFIGGDARLGIAGLPVILNPSFDYYFIDEATISGTTIDRSLYTIDFNALYELGASNTVVFTPYAGAGIGILNFSTDPDQPNVADGADVGLNLIAGARFQFTVIKPFVQAKIKVGGDYNLFGVMGGLLIGF